MANLPGTSANTTPGVFTFFQTISAGSSLPGGSRVGVLMGEGQRQEILVSSALGAGKDGLDPTYSTSSGADGRHFALTFFPLVENRTTLLKNGIPLVGLEQEFDKTTSGFSSLYDYRVDISTGHIELQVAALVDQGGAFYLPNQLNVGNGTISNLSLDDIDAPSESWTVKCISTKRDTNGHPIDGYGQFIATGSVSGTLLDGYGNQVIWRSNGTTTTNGILQFQIQDGSIKFIEGDKFTIKVKGGALVKGDTLVANYIPVADINDIQVFTDMKTLSAKHGQPSLTNRVSLGGQLAFANSPPGMLTCQTAPAIPRRVSYELRGKASGGQTFDDLSFPLPLNVIPDVDSNIHFFVTDPSTGIESQILPNKFSFYDAATTASPSGFTSQATFHSFSYTVVLENSVKEEGEDGATTSIGPHSATFASNAITFTSNDVGLSIHILSPSPNVGTYPVASVSNGVATITSGGSFTSTSNEEFEVIDVSASSAQVLFTKDIALTAGESLRATVVDERDATFYDVGWQSALEALEAVELDMVIPLPSQTISSIFQAARIHCDTMSDVINRKERVLLIGAINGLTPDNVLGNTLAAVEDIGVLEGIQGDSVSEILAGDTEDLANYDVQAAFGTTFRVIYFYPDQIVVNIAGDNTIVDGFFMAAAAGGFLSAVQNVAVPLTNKVIAGFTILRNRLFRPTVLANLANSGITVVQPTIGGGLVVWGKTTTTSGFVEEEEISIIFIRDRVAKSIRLAFQGFIGIVDSATLQGSLMARANSALQGFVASGLISAFASLTVARDSVDPTQWNISVMVQPTYPVNFVLIEASIGLIAS